MFRQAFSAASKAGDLNLAVYSFDNLNTNYIANGDPLVDAQRQAEAGLAFAQKARFGHQIDIISTQLALIRTLRGLTREFGRFDDDDYREDRVERHYTPNPSVYWVMQLQARFLAGNYPAALHAAARAQEKLWTLGAMFETAEYHFYAALSRAASWRSATRVECRQHVEALAAHYRQLMEWVGNCPANFENRAALVGAEIARIEGREADAERLYELAIRSSRENEFVHNEALAYELAARFYLARGFEDFGMLYLRKARHRYLRWGADGKVRQLELAFPALKEDDRGVPPTSTIIASSEGLDLATVLKVSQALSGEIVLENMIDSLMRIAITHAGASRGLLILAKPVEHWIVAEATTVGDAVPVQMRNDPVAAGGLPRSVYHYVVRTRESVILDDAATQGAFTSDAYIVEQRVRSILCLPLLKQTTLVGVLYLENSLAARAFTPARIAVLDLIASQAAIALENSRLYADLQKAHRLEAMGTLAGGVAHDFNNLLGAILGYGEMALRGAAAKTQLRRDLEAIMVAVERGRSLVERVLDFSKSGVAERVAVHVEDVVREALDQLAAQLPESIVLEADLRAGEAALLGDATQVHQVVMNLCANAAQAMPDGGALSVALRLERFETKRAVTIGRVDESDYMVLRVGDTGSGIPAHILEQIFDPFFTTKVAGSGTGLGLSLVHGIVTQLGGAIDVASEPGKGSTFTVYLPRSAAVAPESADGVELPLPRGGAQCVLVVDDEELLVNIAARTLQELGYVPINAISGAAALAALHDDPDRFDAMITDERMPGLTGCALIRQVRSARPEMPVLLMSGYVDAALLERAQEAGADGVLKKPLSARSLATALERVLQK